MSRRAGAIAVLALSTVAIAGPYAASATAATEQATPIEVAPNATTSAFCILNGNICIF